MEKELYHENLEFLYQRFGSERMFVPVAEIADVLGYDKRTLEADPSFPMKRMGRSVKAPLTGVARWMCC